MAQKNRISRRELKLNCKLLQIQIDASNKAVATAMTSAEKVIDKNEVALKEYKVGANEWRSTVQDLVSRMPTRTEIESQLKSIESAIGELKESRSAIGGKDSAQQHGQATIALWIGIVLASVISFAGLLVAIFWHH